MLISSVAKQNFKLLKPTTFDLWGYIHTLNGCILLKVSLNTIIPPPNGCVFNRRSKIYDLPPPHGVREWTMCFWTSRVNRFSATSWWKQVTFWSCLFFTRSTKILSWILIVLGVLLHIHGLLRHIIFTTCNTSQSDFLPLLICVNVQLLEARCGCSFCGNLWTV